MNAYLRLGLAALCVIAAIAIATVQPEPASLYSVANAPSTEPNGAVRWDGRPFAVAFLEPLVYNETRDATLAGTLICSHKPCGPLVWVKGDLNATRVLSGPFLLRPTSNVLTIERFPTPAPNESEPTIVTPSGPPSYGRSTPYDAIRFAIAEPFDAGPVLPAALGVAALRLAPLFLLAFVPADVAPWRRAIVGVAVLAGGWLGYSASDESWGILGYVAILFPFTIVALLGFLAIVVAKKRVHPEWLAAAALGIAFFLALAAFEPYAPASGAGD